MTPRMRNVARLAAIGALCAASPAIAADKEIVPYLEVAQVLTADLKDGGDVLTYTALAAGIDAGMTTSRSEFQASYRYERRIDYQKDVGDADVHSGLARGRFDLVPGALSIEAGAIAARARSDIRGPAPVLGAGRLDNVTQVYSAYAGPTFGKDVGPVTVSAAYRLGYTAVEEKDVIVLPGGQPPLDAFDDSVAHLATVGIAAAPGDLPFGWQASAGWEREDANQLDQLFESKFLRYDVTFPVTHSVALIGGVGYEDTEISERTALLDAGGNPVFDTKGRLVTDPASPRLLAYDQDGIFWDAGIMWRPSQRTSLEARAGRRYGSMSYTGSFSWAATRTSLVQVGVYDNVETFAQRLNDGVAGLPTRFTVARNSLNNLFGGCVFGGERGGGCLTDAFQAITTASFRNRGITAVWSATRGRWGMGVGAGYSNRKYLVPVGASFAPLAGVTDELWFAQGNVSRELTPNSSASADVYIAHFDSGIAGAPDVLSTGATGAYYHQFGRNLSASAALGLYSYRQEDFDSTLNLIAQIAMRYSF